MVTNLKQALGVPYRGWELGLVLLVNCVHVHVSQGCLLRWQGVSIGLSMWWALIHGVNFMWLSIPLNDQMESL